VIDLHNHILPGLDDGAADLAESVAIARRFAGEGVQTIAATPHFNPHRQEDVALLVRECVSRVRAALEDEGISLTVVPGNEILLTPDVPGMLERGACLPLGGGSGVLVECPFDLRPPFLEDTLFTLQLAGYQPLLAHPERYTFVQRDPSVLDDVVDRGIVLQLTAPSLLGEYGGRVRRTAHALLERGLYACAASDRHHPTPGRSLFDLPAQLAQLLSPTSADLLLRENPRRVLEGQPVERLPAAKLQNAGLFERLFSRNRGPVPPAERE